MQISITDELKIRDENKTSWYNFICSYGTEYLIWVDTIMTIDTKFLILKMPEWNLIPFLFF